MVMRAHPRLKTLLLRWPGARRNKRTRRVIYALVSPEDEVLYIGYTTNLSKRLKDHLANSHSRGLREWRATGGTFRAVVIEYMTKAIWERKERRWIGRARILGRVFNVQHGGIFVVKGGRLVAKSSLDKKRRKRRLKGRGKRILSPNPHAQPEGPRPTSTKPAPLQSSVAGVVRRA